MPDLICPVCFAIGEPVAVVGAVSVCADCGASIATDADGRVRRATGADTTALTVGEQASLRRARGRLVRPERQG